MAEKKKTTKYIVWETHFLHYKYKRPYEFIGVFSSKAKAINAIVKNHEFEPDAFFRNGMLGDRPATRKDVDAWIRKTIAKSPLDMVEAIYIYDIGYQISEVEENEWNGEI